MGLDTRIVYGTVFATQELQHGIYWVGQVGPTFITVSPSTHEARIYRKDPALQGDVDLSGLNNVCLLVGMPPNGRALDRVLQDAVEWAQDHLRTHGWKFDSAKVLDEEGLSAGMLFHHKGRFYSIAAVIPHPSGYGKLLQFADRDAGLWVTPGHQHAAIPAAERQLYEPRS